jgi:hypothetical protein
MAAPGREGVAVVVSAAAKVTSATTEISWSSEQRVAHVRYVQGARLASEDGDFLVDALRGWVGSEGEPFAILADAAGLQGTDGAYRAKASGFFRLHRDHSFIALIHVGPVIHVVVELFSLGTGIPLKTFPSEVAARSWLRSKGIAT